MSGSIFISYRQEDAKAWAVLVGEALVEAFGEDEVFLDKDALHAGGWNDQLRAAVERSRAVLVLIGKRWLTVADADGPRLARADDVHHMEISRALRQADTTVLPVLVDKAALPERGDLPDDIRGLVSQQAFELSDDAARRAVDLARIVGEVAGATGLKSKRPKQPSPWSALRTLAKALGVALGASVVIPVAGEAACGTNLKRGEVGIVAAIAFVATIAAFRVRAAMRARALRRRPGRTGALSLTVLFTVGSLVYAGAGRAARNRDARRPGRNLMLACAPERAVVRPGDRVSVRAWLTDAAGAPAPEGDHLRWTTSMGAIEGEVRATWSVPPTALGASKRPVEATATVAIAGPSNQPQPTCTLSVFVAKGASVSEPTATVRGFVSGKALLLPTVADPQTDDKLAGYGLYSYLLFDGPPRDQLEHARYLKVIESYLRELPAIAELENHVPRSGLNITMILVQRAVELPGNVTEEGPAAQGAVQILAQYDYARAKAVLDQLGDGDYVGGPFLASVTGTAARAKVRRSRLVLDMRRASPAIVEEWLRTFCWLAAKERSWSEVTLKMVALNMRNVVSIAARRVPETFGDIPGIMRIAIGS